MQLPEYKGRTEIRRIDGQGINIIGLGHFNLEYSAECGQAFRWDWDPVDECYTGIIRGRVIKARQDGDSVLLLGTSSKEDADLFLDYFNIMQDSRSIEESLASRDSNLAAAVARHPGMKIARQEPWECIISYIISARNNIPNIKKTVGELSKRFGTGIPGTGYFTFPTPEALALAPMEELLECKAAFRTRYIKETARAIYEGTFDADLVSRMDREEARLQLMGLPGIGPKVADCVMLFSMGQYSSFPIDVWIARAMQHWYFEGTVKPLKDVQAYAVAEFGELAGYANQHLFFHARDIKLGRKSAC